MIEQHEQEKAFECEMCDKGFVLEWRMKKHMKMHGEKLSMCKYFAKNQHCPYEDIGCKFSHESSEKDNNDDENDDEDHENDEELDDSYEFCENQCHLCKLQLPCKDDLYCHVETDHEEYHLGMLEVIANRRNNI